MAAGTVTDLIPLKPDCAIDRLPGYTTIRMFRSVDGLFHSHSSETISIQFSTSGLHCLSYSQDIISSFPFLLAQDCWNDHKGIEASLQDSAMCLHWMSLSRESPRPACQALYKLWDCKCGFRHGRNLSLSTSSTESWTTKNDWREACKLFARPLLTDTSGIWITSLLLSHWRSPWVIMTFHGSL